MEHVGARSVRHWIAVNPFNATRFALLFGALLAACSPGVVAPNDVAQRSDGRVDASFVDTRTDSASDATIDAVAPLDVVQPLDARADVPADVPFTIPGCTPSGGTFSVTYAPSPPVAPGGMTVNVFGPDPVANIVVELRSTTGRVLSPQWIGVVPGYHWSWSVAVTYPGDYCVTVTGDPSGHLYYRGTLHIGGSDPTDAGVPPTDSGTPGAFVTRSGAEFMVGSSRLRFVGMNVRGLPHFGTPMLPYANTSQIDTQLDEVQRMGARVIRVFAAAHDADAATVAARLDHVLASAEARGIYVIIALTDFYNTGFSPRGDDGYFTDVYSSLRLLGASFFAGGYRDNYLPWVRAVVTRHRNSHAVFAWELGNEIKCDANHAAFLSFATDVGNTIRGIAPNHLIASGMITSAWMNMTEARAFYGASTMDVITLHEYNGTHAFDESWASREFSKPWIVEEAGFDTGGRAAAIDADIRYWIDGQGGRGYMQWGFTVITPDNGDGDNQFGMDHLAHAGDYGALFTEYQSTAARIR